MDVLLVIGPAANPDGIKTATFSPADRVVIFPLTSRDSLVRLCAERIRSRGASVETVPGGERVHAAAAGMRERFLRFVADLPEQAGLHGRFALDDAASLWWFSLVAEKNTLKSSAFNSLCQMDALVLLIRERGIRRIVWHADRGPLERALRGYADGCGLGFHCGEPSCLRAVAGGRIGALAKAVCHMLFFAAKQVVFAFRVRRVMRQHPMDFGEESLPVVAYYPFFDMEQARQGRFLHRHCAALQEALRAAGRRIQWLVLAVEGGPVPLGESLEYADRFAGNGVRLHFLEEFLHPGAHVAAVGRMLRYALRFLAAEPAIEAAHRFDDYNFYELFRRDWTASFAGKVGLMGLLYYESFKAFLRRTRGGRCLYFLENQAWERALLSAGKAVGSSASFYGHQFGTISPLFLNFFSHPSEFSGEGPYPMPRPHRILCNGRESRSRFMESGWPDADLPVVEAIRYLYLKRWLGSRPEKGPRAVLVLLSIGFDEGLALVSAAHEALRGVPDVEVRIRPHPIAPFDRILAVLGFSKGRPP